MSDVPSLKVDSASVSLSEVWVHEQDDPYPGGHTFVLSVPYERLGKWKETLTATPIGALNRTTLKMVKWKMSDWPRLERGSDVARFVLNSVTAVAFEESTIVVTGVCSAHLRDFDEPNAVQ
jgi:hypothetical protein